MADTKNNQERLLQTEALFAYEKALYDAGACVVVGIDEVGRGALAGPVTAAAVVLGADWQLVPGLNDSKQLSAKQRTELSTLLTGEGAESVHNYCIAHVDADYIDQHGIMPALRCAMKQAFEGLAGRGSAAGGSSLVGGDTSTEPVANYSQLHSAKTLSETADKILIDGHPLGLFPQEEAIIKGDSKIACIAAASILAKVARDELMVETAERYPEYDFDSNKGYTSAKHQEAIAKHGLSSVHRRSFCQNFLQKSLF